MSSLRDRTEEGFLPNADRLLTTHQLQVGRIKQSKFDFVLYRLSYRERDKEGGGRTLYLLSLGHIPMYIQTLGLSRGTELTGSTY